MVSPWMPALKAGQEGRLLPCVVRVLNYEAQPEAFEFEYFAGFGIRLKNLDDARRLSENLNEERMEEYDEF